MISPGEHRALLIENREPRSTEGSISIPASPMVEEYDYHLFDFASVPSRFGLMASKTPQALRLLVASISRFLSMLLPSFIHSRSANKANVPKPKLHATSFLDGIRGIAALFVVFFHMSYTLHDNSHGYGFRKFNSPLRLPFLYLIWGCGTSMVSVFFVVSGYSLSIKPVKTMRQHDFLEFRRSISSSAFRRVFRLYLPVVASTLLIVLLLRLGVYEWTRPLAMSPFYLHISEYHPVRMRTIEAQLKDWLQQMYYFINTWTANPKGNHPPYDHHLWSIATEMRCSMNLFIVQTALAGLTPTARMLTLSILILWCRDVFFFGTSLFYAGFLIAELSHYHGCMISTLLSSLPKRLRPLLPRRLDIYRPLDSEKQSKQRSLPCECYYIAHFICACYLLSCPSKDMERTPGWRWLSTLIPNNEASQKSRYWPSIGAMQLVWAVSSSTSLQSIFTTSIARYLGKISFMMYILHGTVIHTLGYLMYKLLWSYTGMATTFDKEFGWILASCLTLFYIFWAADIFTRFVDGPSVKFARWLEERLLSKTPSET